MHIARAAPQRDAGSRRGEMRSRRRHYSSSNASSSSQSNTDTRDCARRCSKALASMPAMWSVPTLPIAGSVAQRFSSFLRSALPSVAPSMDDWRRTLCSFASRSKLRIAPWSADDIFEPLIDGSSAAAPPLPPAGPSRKRAERRRIDCRRIDCRRESGCGGGGAATNGGGASRGGGDGESVPAEAAGAAASSTTPSAGAVPSEQRGRPVRRFRRRPEQVIEEGREETASLASPRAASSRSEGRSTAAGELSGAFSSAWGSSGDGGGGGDAAFGDAAGDGSAGGDAADGDAAGGGEGGGGVGPSCRGAAGGAPGASGSDGRSHGTSYAGTHASVPSLKTHDSWCSAPWTAAAASASGATGPTGCSPQST
mmetsp:Transcript_10865/g.34574  ORF Transcript_10865/g.34574 Transcript_10865/m.34574 type:complete len:368 (+) Transcript_10865:202-1305(+)